MLILQVLTPLLVLAACFVQEVDLTRQPLSHSHCYGDANYSISSHKGQDPSGDHT